MDINKKMDWEIKMDINKKMDWEIKEYVKSSPLHETVFDLNLQIDSKKILDKFKERKNSEAKLLILNEFNNDEEIINFIKNRILNIQDNYKKSWKNVYYLIKDNLFKFIEDLFKNNPNKTYYRHTIAIEFKRTTFYKKIQKNIDLDNYFDFDWTARIAEGNKKIQDIINHIKSDIRQNYSPENKDKYNNFYIVRGQNSKENEIQAGWKYTDDEFTIQEEILKSGKMGALRTLSNFNYGIKRNLLNDDDITSEEVQKIIAAIDRHLVDKIKEQDYYSDSYEEEYL